MMPDVIVIGGGLAGLACGVALADRGKKVVVLERDTLLGGRARSWTDEKTGDTVDIGPHVLHSEYLNMLAFLERLGTRGLVTWQPGKVLTIAGTSGTFVLRHWPLLPSPLSLMPSVVLAPGPSIAQHLTAARTLWRGMQFGEEDVPELDRMSALDFLRSQGMDQSLIDWWWRFAAIVVTNVPIERCSAAALMRIHAHLSGHRKLHFGFAAVGLSELYASQAVRAIEAAGGEVRMGCAVRGIAGHDRAEGVVLDDGTVLRAPHVVAAVPPQALAPLLPETWRHSKPFDALGAFEPCPYISCYLWFDRRVMQERFMSYTWTPERLNYDFYDLAQIRRGWEGRPSVIASNIIYSHRAHGMSDEEVIRATVEELCGLAPEAAHAQLLHARVHRIPMAIPCPAPGTEVKRPASRTAIAGLILAGDWLHTRLPCCMEGAVRSGWLAAEQVLADAGMPCTLAIPPRPYDGLAGLVRRVSQWQRRRTGRRQAWVAEDGA
jgi:squalene-associated FAD-dependent desaturase